MPSSGHGVSEAVRNHIHTWITDEVASAIYEVSTYTSKSLPHFAMNLRTSKNWKRVARRRRTGGFEREFHNAGIPASADVALYVHSPASDYSADAYLIKVKGKLIAGGKTKLQSVFNSTITSRDKTELTTPKFVPFTQAQLAAAQVRYEYGDGFDQLEVEREI